MRRAGELKRAARRAAQPHQPLAGKTLGMIFEKASTRTRVASRSACTSSAATRSTWRRRASQIGRGEPLRDTARVLGRLLPRHRHPHLRSRRRRGAGALRAGAGDQRAHRSVAPVSGAGRSVHRLGAARPRRARARRRALRLDRRRQQHGALVDRGRRHPRARSLARLPRGLRPRRRGAGARAQATAIGARTSRSCATRPRRRAGATCCRPTSGPRWARRASRRARARPSPASASTTRCLQLAGARRDRAALPAGAPRRGDHRRGARGAALGGVPAGREPACTCRRRSWNACSRHAKTRRRCRVPSEGLGPDSLVPARSDRPRSLGSSSAPTRASCSRASTAQLTVGQICLLVPFDAEVTATILRRLCARRRHRHPGRRAPRARRSGAATAPRATTPPARDPRPARRRRSAAVPPTAAQAVDGLDLTVEQARRIDEFFSTARIARRLRAARGRARRRQEGHQARLLQDCRRSSIPIASSARTSAPIASVSPRSSRRSRPPTSCSATTTVAPPISKRSSLGQGHSTCPHP